MSSPNPPDHDGRPYDPESSSTRRVIAISALAVSLLVVIGVFIFALADIFGGTHGYDKPWPTFPSLAAEPDPSFRGTVAYIADPSAPKVVEENGESKMMKDSCAYVVRASGGAPTSVVCWPMSDRELASVAWIGGGKLRITGFEEGQSSRPIPAWGKIADIALGTTTDVAPEDLESNAFPEPPSTTNGNGETLVVKNSEGSSKVTVESSDVTRVVFSVSSENPSFSIVGDPQWSNDGKWFVMYDGRRLLTTTNEEVARTRVLADGVSGAIGEWGATTFAMTTLEW